MAGVLLTEETVATALRLITSLAVETVPGSVGAGVTVVGPSGGPRTSGATDGLVDQADRLQYELGEGPCLAAAAGRQVVRVDDISSDPRWPRWAVAVAPLGLRAALSAPLVAGSTALGALKVYADHPGTFDVRSEHLLTMFSAQAAILVANVQSYERAQRLSDELRRTVATRDLVCTARGVLMCRDGVDADAAFVLLVARARAAGVTVQETARAVVDSAVRRRR